MKKVIVLASVTYALRSQEVLKDNGIYSSLTRSKAVRSVRGCGYGVAVDPTVFKSSADILIAAGIPMIGYTEEK